ncbi:unnamed protein product [Allacma fusca]|uniref:Uncharacterized protein n=1 Tax=Allacma fusca TaxID=39272 RepID=A0A8J2KIC9_9HEXA|nr:unnamed protein product [Allacma fusca]
MAAVASSSHSSTADSPLLMVKFGGFKMPGSSSPNIQDSCCFEGLYAGFQEVVYRVHEMKNAFGTNDVDHFCVQVQDYVSVLMDREKNRLKYQGNSPERAARPTMVKFMMQIAEGEELTRATLHLAMYLYDRFADCHSIPITQLWLAALCCLVIAGKLEERDAKTPKVRKLQAYLPAAATFSTRLFTELEKYILDYFKWSLLLPNAYTFLEFFALFIIDAHEERNLREIESNNNNNFLSFSLQDGHFSTRNVNTIRFFAVEVLDTLLCEEPNDDFPPSLVAASTMMLSRRVHGYCDWSERLQFITKYSKAQVLTCCQMYIQKIYESQSTKCCCSDSSYPKL